MRLIINLLRSVWAVICYIHIGWVISLTAIFVLITSLIFGEKSKRTNLFVCLHLACPLILWLCGIWVSVKGREYIKRDQSYIVVSNHVSYLDIFANPMSMPYWKIFTFLAKIELGKTPVFGIIAKNLGMLVDRKNLNSRKEAFDKMKQNLNTGLSIFVYPEGTRNRTDEPLLHFYDGAFRIAVDMNVPILVNTLVGMPKINNNRRSLDMCPGVIRSYFAPPIFPEGKTVAQLKDEVRKIMLGYLAGNES